MKTRIAIAVDRYSNRLYCSSLERPGTMNGYEQVEELFAYLMKAEENEMVKIVFRVPGLSPDYKFYKRLFNKKNHYLKWYENFEQKFRGHLRLLDNKWNEKIQTPLIPDLPRYDGRDRDLAARINHGTSAHR